MRLQFGSQLFVDVSIPLLWGTRAVVGHPNGTMSILDLGGKDALPEIIKDRPAPGTEFAEQEDGFLIFKNNQAAYFYSPRRHILRDTVGALPECEITNDRIRVGGSTLQNCAVGGFGVGVGVTENGFFIGGPIPPGLAPLKV